MFSGLSFHPHHSPLKAREKPECACPVRDNGRVSGPWPYRLGPFFLDQALPLDTVGYCSRAWQQKEGKHLLRFFFSRLTPSFFSLSVTGLYIFFFSFEGFGGLFKDGQELKQVPCLKFIRQLYNPPFWQLSVTRPNRAGVAVASSINALKQFKCFICASACVQRHLASLRRKETFRSGRKSKETKAMKNCNLVQAITNQYLCFFSFYN